MQNVIAVLSETLRRRIAARFRRPDEQVDDMFITLVDERRHFPTIDVIQAASDQGKAAIGKILYRRGEFELSVEPGFDRMLIRRRNIEKVSGEQGANVTGNNFLYEWTAARAVEHSPLIQEHQPKHNADRRSQG